MSMNWGESANEPGRGWGFRGSGRRRWKTAEIAVIVLGFIVYWPVGLAMLGFKIWQQKTNYSGDLASFCREAWNSARSGDWSASPLSRPVQGFRGWGCGARGSWSSRGTGNSAFDDWRDSELARLEEERRKLAAAEREFSDFMSNLRRAKDREEFDRFMRERGQRSPASDSSGAAG